MPPGRLIEGIIVGAAGAALAGMLLAPAAPASDRAASAAPPSFFGVVTQGAEGLAAGEVGRARRGGIGTVRLLVPWGRIEASLGRYSWSALDRQLRRIDRAGAAALPFIHGSPSRFGPEGTPKEVPACGFCTFTGLLDAAGKPKPAWRAFKEMAGG